MNKTIRHYNEYCQESKTSIEAIDVIKDVDKSKPIKDMSRKELWYLIERLRSEREAESLIRDLKINSGESGADKIDISTPVNQLYHYGILGQKWGRRRFQNPDGTRTKAGKIREQTTKQEIDLSDDHKQAISDRNKATKGLSNEDLKRLNTRLQLEKTYKELTDAEKKKGESFVKGILKDIAKGALTESGKKLATNLLNTFITDPLSDLVKKEGGDKKGGNKK